MRAGKIPCCSHCVLTGLSLLSASSMEFSLWPLQACALTMIRPCHVAEDDHIRLLIHAFGALHVFGTFEAVSHNVYGGFWELSINTWSNSPPSLHFHPAMDMNAHNQELLQQLALLQGQQALLDAQAALVLMRRRRRRNSCMLYLIVVECKCGHSKTPRMNEIAWHMAQYL